MTEVDAGGPGGHLRLAAAALQELLVVEGGAPRSLPALERIDRIAAWLDAAVARCAEAPPAARKAAEWLTDNDYIVRRAIRNIRSDMPAEFYQRLVRVAGSNHARLPRVYLLAHGYLDTVAMQPTLGSLCDFVAAYQKDAELRIAELWAIAPMLRIACIETLSVAFGKLLSDLDPPVASEPAARYVAKHDPTDCVARAITALSALSTLPWKDFFDRTSLVEAALRQDPAAVYSSMDFDSRDLYRREVEELSRGSGLPETEIVRRASARSATEAFGARGRHVGQWLVGDGRRDFEASVNYRASPGRAFRRFLEAYAQPLYFSALAILGLFSLFLPVAVVTTFSGNALIWVAGFVVSLLPASIIAITLTHWVVTQVLPPRVLPKLDFERGFPDGFRAAVAMPVIFRGADEIRPFLESCETNWLTNPSAALKFVVLSDLPDAPAETTAEDAAIETALVTAIAELNARHAASRPFVLLHRRRSYNSVEGIWLGWERKRGKLSEFNALLRTGRTDAFAVREGDVGALPGTDFVITLDADTILPPGAAHRLLGAIAHPLNRPRFDETTGRVTSGYTFVQPRVEIAPAAGALSAFTRLYTGDTAIDIYSRAVSDVYQDLFGEGIFTGKGAYDVAAFERALAGRVPENAILSHDLFEGLHGRTALASDIVFYEGFPADYPGHVRRSHRWIRGDWQLLPWLGRRVPGEGGELLPTRFGALDLWRIADNMRRSLIPPALLLLAVMGWFALPGPAWLWTVLTLAAPGAYLFTDLVTSLARGRRRDNLSGSLRVYLDHAGRWALAIAFLPYEAVVAVDAIVRALWRMRVSRRGLLEWTAAAHATGGAARLMTYWRTMWSGPALAAAIGALLWVIDRGALAGAAPLLVLWLMSPEIARIIDRPFRRTEAPLGAEDRAFLRGIARRTWYFFEMFAGPEDNWLPPDNYQFDPRPEVAHRTSPTNIGMLLASAITARDLGYSGLQDFAARTRSVLDTMDRMEHHRGHLLNWYDTRSLAPLEPRYVSTVDSGNLAVALVTLRGACLEFRDGAVMPPALWQGLSDTLTLMEDALAGIAATERAALLDALDGIRQRLANIASAERPVPSELVAVRESDFAALKTLIVEAIRGAGPEAPVDLHEVQVWVERGESQLSMMIRELQVFLPWLGLLERSPAGLEDMASRIGDTLGPNARLADMRLAGQVVAKEVRALARGADAGTAREWLAEIEAALGEGLAAQGRLANDLSQIAGRAGAAADAMDFAMLYDPEPRIFHIGYNLSTDRLDQHHYDLIASEARLASYFAIAKRDVPAEHWFHLGRPITRVDGALTVLSWNGSMFEFLMPALFLSSEAGRLMGQSDRAAVVVQQRHGARLGLPWGVSESAFALRDGAQNYQYQAFGVPGLGLRLGLSEDSVVAPYASGLALAVAPASAVRNLRALNELGLRGTYGMFEAADFTPKRQRGGSTFLPVRAYMAHHQGMMLTAIGNVVAERALPSRFSSDPRMRAIELLLQERVPWDAAPEPPREKATDVPDLTRGAPPPPLGAWTPEPTWPPEVLVLGNGRFGTTITATGDASLSWRGQAMTRSLTHGPGEENAFRIYLQDLTSGDISVLGRAPSARTTFHGHMAEFHQVSGDISVATEIFVAPRDDLEIRRLTLVNNAETAREITVTSAAEVVLARPEDHERHPAFSKLFVKSEFLPGERGLLFSRRPRRAKDRPPVLLHRLHVDDDRLSGIAFETDRAAFLGRSVGSSVPQGLVTGLGGAQGFTLDPVMALQGRVRLEPGARVQIAFSTIAAPSREAAMDLARQYSGHPAFDWAFAEAQRAAASEAAELLLSPDDLILAQKLASRLLSGDAGLRSRRPGVGEALFGQPALWSLGVSGDLPILLASKGPEATDGLIPVLVQVHRWWQRRGLSADLVVLRTGATGYEEPMRQSLTAAMREAGVVETLGVRGGIHLSFADLIGQPARQALSEAARLVIDADRSDLAEALKTAPPEHEPLPRFVPVPGPPAVSLDDVVLPDGLLFPNGLGGFAPDGSAYVIHLKPGQSTPQPWCNVLANDGFGTVVTEAGGGFTWAVNSGENRLTPWSNDLVADPPGEVVYLRDEETAAIWSVAPAPCGENSSCLVTHAQGFTRWERNGHGLRQALTVLVPEEAPVKLAILRLTNPGNNPRRVTATYYAEWILGAVSPIARPHVVCDYDPGARALLARNAWSPEFADRVAFLTASRRAHSLTADRRAFLGPGGRKDRPAGLVAWDLGGKTSDAPDACAAYQVHIDLAPGATEEVVFAIGQGRDRDDAVRLATEWQDVARARAAEADIPALWSRRLGAVEVRTPDPAFDLIVNRWLLYQTFSSRILARSGFHQSGGAYGFRDQLQDMLAVLPAEPHRVRAHIIECASRQFTEGDVLHWWHPPSGRGVRTRCSDDMLWLPYVTARYVASTGDLSILDEQAPFLTAAPLRPEEEDRYAHYDPGSETASILDHGLRALERGVTEGAHGLPLIGSGDWNDGMDAVGRHGRGESVWLAWFAAAVCDAFADTVEQAGRPVVAGLWRERAVRLRDAADANAWDGEWYKRAFDDDGLPWGSRTNDECKIDSIAQSWSVLTGRPAPRAGRAMESLGRHLIDDGARLVRLLTPPFDDTERDPGYIRAYPPGVRENGGQYTHAATWAGLAYAAMGDGDAAYRVFDIINPIRRGDTAAKVESYRAEPYSVPADVLGAAPHTGRAGWTWYTGAAGWTWQLAVEGILGVRLVDGKLDLRPRLPRAWPKAEVILTQHGARLRVIVENGGPAWADGLSITVDDKPWDGGAIPFPEPGKERLVVAIAGPRQKHGREQEPASPPVTPHQPRMGSV